jgi:hypothetical protein
MTELERLIAEQAADDAESKGRQVKSNVRVTGIPDTATQFKVEHGQDFHQEWWNEADPNGDYFGEGPKPEQDPVKLETGGEPHKDSHRPLGETATYENVLRKNHGLD